MVACRYKISLLVLNSNRDFSYLHAPVYYSLFIGAGLNERWRYFKKEQNNVTSQSWMWHVYPTSREPKSCSNLFSVESNEKVLQNLVTLGNLSEPQIGFE